MILGKKHALRYPVSVTSALLPLRPMEQFFDTDTPNAFRNLFRGLFQSVTRFQSFNQILGYLGLSEYPETEGEAFSPYGVPFPAEQISREGKPRFRMGLSLIRRHGVEGFTVSCAGCHATTLFGRPILGLSNRFPRENEFFLEGKKATRIANPALFRLGMRANAGETRIYSDLRDALRFVEVRAPLRPGLDTSLAQVALSLELRGEDPWAEKTDAGLRTAVRNELSQRPADSKPAPWWNLKYKNRWLLDGSVSSGNPVFTNFIWNEIGRGTDLRELDAWMRESKEEIEELTTAVFATEAPRFTDFFPAERISLERAKRGEGLFRESCAKCHGNYEKAWSLAGASALSLDEQARTLQVRYPEQTRVVDVGTDPLRYEGMRFLAPLLNRLEISRRNEIVIEPQHGYVPPPLVGIFARFPYFHNNSAPNLCAVLTREEERGTRYWAGEPTDPFRHFDQDCVGYPVGDRTPSEWKDSHAGHLYEGGLPGLSTQGHSERILVRDGKEIYGAEEKRDLIEFLKTL